jgi:cyclohexa-1,5-dienecarbonyl-CoA hydratase
MKMMEELISAFREVEDKDTIVTVVSAEGKHFSAGAEIKEHFPDKAVEMIEKFTELVKTILESRKITIALVRGYALGGGFEIPLVCDMVLASSNAKLGNPEILLAHYPPISLSILPHIIPSKLAFEFIVTGETFDAENAREMGIVNHVFPEDKFEEMADEFINKLVEKSPIALLLTKKAFKKSLSLSFDEKSKVVNDIYLNELIKTEDAVEGLNAFLEKRKPKWKGK